MKNKMNLIEKYTDNISLYLYQKNIYLILSKKGYDLGMLFLHAQETYESPNINFRSKDFTFIEYVDWYSSRERGIFDYSAKWLGFNLPDYILKILYTKPKDLGFGKYDELMCKIYNKVQEISGEDKYYLIGAEEKDEQTIDHEFAHALYYLNPVYKKEANSLIEKINRKTYKAYCKYLINYGYNDLVLDDEVQAFYASTKPYEMKYIEERFRIDKKINKEFNSLLEKYRE